LFLTPDIGQKLKQPPFKAYVEELKASKGKSSSGHIPLSEGQVDFLHRALAELKVAGTDISGCKYSKVEIRKIDQGLAADVIVRVQRHYRNWVPEDASSRMLQGALSRAGHLVAKLLPIAKKQVLVLKESREKSFGTPDNAILVRVTPAFIKEIASLLATVRDNHLDYVAKSMRETAHAWSARYLSSPGGSFAKVSQVFVSPREFWFKAELGWGGYTRVIETDRMPISAIVPLELLVPEFFVISEQRAESVIKRYEDRIRAIEAAENLYSTISDSTGWIEPNLPSQTIALMDRLWFDRGQGSPFKKQIQRSKELEDTLEEWDAIIEEEKSELVRDVLGISAGDDVSFSRKGKVVKLRVMYAHAYITSDEVSFHLNGQRYKKDGLLGKLDEFAYLRVARESK